MKKIIAKTLSILLVIAMLVPMMGIMTSAEEGLVDISKEPDFSATDAALWQYYNCEEENLKPGDVITIAPVSKSMTSIINIKCKVGNSSSWKYYKLKDLYIEDISFGTAIVQFTIPDAAVGFEHLVLKMLSDYTLMTVNQPFGAKEYLDYMKGEDLSLLAPEKYTGEFENVFSISDVRLEKTINSGKESNSTNYAASAYIPVLAGDVVYFASAAARTVYFYDSNMNYVGSVSSSYQIPIFNNVGCIVNAFQVPENVAYMRFSVQKDNIIATVVTVNQPITSLDEYLFLTTPVLTVKGNYTYTGTNIVPDVEVTIGGKVLVKNEDYTLSYNNRLNAGTARVTAYLRAKENLHSTGKKYTISSVFQTFAIAPKSVEDASVTFNLSSNKYTYTGEEIKPAFTLIVDQTMLSLDRDFTLEYTNNTNAGTATVTATFIRNYSGTISKTFTILPKELPLDSSNLVLSRTEYEYTGSPIIPEVSFSIPGKNLEEGKDYTITCENNVNAGTATVTATLIGNYSGSISKTFTIAPREVVLVWENTDMMYNGERQTPTAKLFGVVAGDVCDVTVSGWGKFGGTYTAKVESISNENYVLSGDTTCQFTIIANPIEVAIDVACDIYDIIPDSAKQAVADAAVEAAKNAASDLANAAYEAASDLADTAIEAAETKAAEIKDTVESAYDQARDFFTGLFGSFSFFG